MAMGRSAWKRALKSSRASSWATVNLAERRMMSASVN
jgi:hypothetical protein